MWSACWQRDPCQGHKLRRAIAQPGWVAAAAVPTSDVQLAIIGLQAMQLANLRHRGRLLHDCQQVGPG